MASFRWGTCLRLFLITTGLVATSFGAISAALFLSAHRRPMCGNCLLGSTGVALEITAIGLLLLFAGLLGVRYRLESAGDWGGLISGLIATPFVIGVPIFLVCLVFLAYPVGLAAVRLACRRFTPH